MKPYACAFAIACSLVVGRASANVVEPNGLQVPIDSSPEIQLYTLFQQRGDPIDWQADAHDTPNAFSPSCGFGATYVLNQAGSHFGLAWYNETGAPPAQLFPLVPPNSPVGTMFNGASIKNDPNYAGGLVGFALVGGETHYTNAAYDNKCFGPPICAAPDPWILALIYPSKSTPGAYYIAFEDGNTSPFSLGNDGDFNDDVYFVTGINCQGGGDPCNTGQPGICGAGATQCTASGNLCLPLSPAQPETCNGLDDDCNGIVDDGALCDPGYVCQKGTCVMSCQGGEFACPPNQVCSSGYCVDPACSAVTCPDGQICVAGMCKGPCDGVTCPIGQVCRVGACVDPCAGVMCGPDRVCEAGVCVGACTCQPCAGGKQCDVASGLCLEPACVGKSCGAGTICVQGTCVDECQSAVCPMGETCVAGQCIAAMSSSAGTGGTGGSSSASGNFVGAGGAGSGGAGGTNGTGSSGVGGAGDAAGGAGGTHGGKAGGCGVAGEPEPIGMGWLAGAALAIAAARRGRARRSRG